ncbi:hypothetical protein [Granulicella sibirica]|uniref:Uncharacterized protein n=1 Tax=Granulicella sibirica TaxID=2479048 RepID=A0A4V1L662_9BACT|nr:hypothetical protein [Granulicella sibirica]RXH58154.1 hypothetical protein GRAN_1464 [Granulicella sibirica]
MSIEFAPIERERFIAEPSILTDVYPAKFAEIVRIEFKKIQKDRRMLELGRLKLDTRELFVCNSHG